MHLPLTDIWAYVAYAATMCMTPGPNNAMLATLGAKHGFRRAAPAVAGIASVVFTLVFASAIGVAAVVSREPVVANGLMVVGTTYLLYLAFSLWTAEPHVDAREKPVLGFWGALALQAINPKAVLMALTAVGGFMVPSTGPWGAMAIAGLFCLVCVPCCSAWALAGDRLKFWLSSRTRAVAFSRAMALVMALTAATMAFQH